MRGPLKGNNGGGHRVRPYGVMLLLAFGAALLGVLAIHKTRERRNFRLLFQEKDRHFISLHLLLQKEREHTKETKRKNEELKTRLVSLETDKTELSGRILDLHSTISSLRDEGRILESAIQEKEAEIQTLRETNADVEAEIVALTASLKQKDAVIEDLNRRLENPAKTRPAGAENRSNRILDASIGESRQGHSSAHKTDKHDKPNPTTDQVNMGASAGNHDLGRNGTADADERKVSRENHLQTLANSNDRVEDGKSQDITDVRASNIRRHENVQPRVAVDAGEQINTNPIINVREVGKSQKLQSELSTDNKQVDSSSRKEEGNNQKDQGRDPEGRTSDRGAKLEVTDTLQKLGSKRKGKPLLVRANGKRWKVFARNRRLRSSAYQENRKADRTGSKRASTEYQDGAKDTTLEETHEDEQTTDRVEVSLAGSNNQSELKRQEDSPKSQLEEKQYPQKNEPADSEPVKLENDDPKYLVDDAPATDVEDNLYKPVDNVSRPNSTNLPEKMEIPQTYEKSKATINEISGIRASGYGTQSEDADIDDKGQDIDVSYSEISLEDKNAGNEVGFGEKLQEEVLDKEQRTGAAAEDFQIEDASTSKGGKDEEAEETDNFEF